MFLANENFPAPSIHLLRNNSYNVVSIQETAPGISDEDVLKIAIDNRYIILTFDKDYGELIFRYKIENPPAIVFFREKGQSPLFAGELLLYTLRTGSINFKHAFTVIETKNIRQRHYKK